MMFNIIAIDDVKTDDLGNDLIMFSSLESEKNDFIQNQLFVIKNNDVFVRMIVGNRFEYKKPDDGCYVLSCGANICVKEGGLTSIEGEFHNAAVNDKITIGRADDAFFREKNIACNAAKFDIINKLFVKREQIDGYSMQLYLLDYYSVIRLFLYKKNKDSDVISAFIVSDKNDVGCSPFNEYKVYNKSQEELLIGKKNKKKARKIVAKTKHEFLQKLSIESYKPMLLNGYTYLQPINNMNDYEKIVLSIEGTEANYINNVAIDLKWQKIGFDDVFAFEKLSENKKNNKITN